jgi:hypothetical protein
MRKLVLAFATCLMAAGCGGGSNTSSGLSTVVTHYMDLPQLCTGASCPQPPTSPPKWGCSALVDCLNNCPSGDDTCATQCINLSTNMAKQLIQAAARCALAACKKAREGGTARCMSDGDTSSDCSACFVNTLGGGPLAGPCQPTTDPNCGECSMQFEACLQDM